MIETAQHCTSDARSTALGMAVRRTLAYADLFDYPLSARELHRYLHGLRVPWADLHALLTDGVSGVETSEGFYVLAGRLWTVAERQRRATSSKLLTERLQRYRATLKYLPFVRMVALTGSLSMQNVATRDDIDVMVVTAPGRVWLARAVIILLVHLARLTGDALCPNFVVAENALELGDLSIYDAHEIAQMIPLCGYDVYQRLWASNPQVILHLPNACAWPLPEEHVHPVAQALKRGAEYLLGGRIGAGLEAWERGRKMGRLHRQQTTLTTEIVLSADQCKGHFDQHRTRVLIAYQDRLTQVEVSEEEALRPRQEDPREVTRR